MMKKSVFLIAASAIFLLIATLCVPPMGAAQTPGFRFTSPAFKEGETIPVKYTCDGENVSPPLTWEGMPGGTKSLALICDDPDAPSKTWVHWVYFNIPPALNGLPENVPKGKEPETGGLQGNNDSRGTGYTGPCPPGGTHRYFFKLYALDVVLDLKPGLFGVSKKKLLKATEGRVIGEAQLMGTFSR